jgi:hypothetical protein
MDHAIDLEGGGRAATPLAGCYLVLGIEDKEME